MDRQIGYIVIALAAALIFFVAIGYDGWGCGGSILGSMCMQVNEFKITGVLILAAAKLTVIAAIFLILHMVMENRWTKIVSAVLTTLAAICAISGVFNYLHLLLLWSPFLAAISMTLVIVLAAFNLTELFTSND
ncbi:hypothetical protein ECG_03256 [Echinococcus granulosus]|nr:hypothetical protein ECG_09973 [Echinococcus granulosus]KAH9277470.1 hypothetical protein ECG_09974 [Echinococcus granulosus]KAH9284059.1 hypothetical protein ECG_03256 [Echinococcus granulosus]